VEDDYGPCVECENCFLVGVQYPTSTEPGGEQTALVVACACWEYASDEEAGEALADELGPDYRSEATAEGVVLRDSAGKALTVARALEVLHGTGSLSESSSSSSSSS
jgi:hypothetical protein